MHKKKKVKYKIFLPEISLTILFNSINEEITFFNETTQKGIKYLKKHFLDRNTLF